VLFVSENFPFVTLIAPAPVFVTVPVPLASPINNPLSKVHCVAPPKFIFPDAGLPRVVYPLLLVLLKVPVPVPVKFP
jgi:hypothetical protein